MDSEMIADVKSLREKAEEAIQRSDFAAALSSAEAALERLGNTYDYDGVLDDTGMKLMLAETFEENGKLERAAIIKTRMLGTRIALWHAKYNL